VQGHTQGQARLGAAGTGGGNEMRLLDTGGGEVVLQFFTGADITPDPDAITAAGGNGQGLPATLCIVLLPMVEQLVDFDSR
jgi:hypothetical protein